MVAKHRILSNQSFLDVSLDLIVAIILREDQPDPFYFYSGCLFSHEE